MAGNGRRSGGGRPKGTLSAKGTKAGARMSGRTGRMRDSSNAFRARYSGGSRFTSGGRDRFYI